MAELSFHNHDPTFYKYNHWKKKKRERETEDKKIISNVARNIILRLTIQNVEIHIKV